MPFDAEDFLRDLGIGNPISEPAELTEEQQTLQAIAAIEKEMVKSAEILKEADSFKAAQRKAVEEILKQADIIRASIVGKEEEIKDVRFEMRRLERSLNAERDRLEQQRHNRELQAHLLESARQYDLITLAAPWREFAKPHQIDGAHIMANGRRVVLADKMGLGKTLTSIATCDMLKAKKILAITPNDVGSNFKREIQRWAPHRTPILLNGASKAQRRMLLEVVKGLDECFVLLNYEAWRKDLQLVSDLIECKFDTLIIDEAHVIKDTKSIAFRGIERIAYTENLTMDDARFDSDGNLELFGRCSVQNIFPMTGTPILNRPQDLFPLLSLTMRDRFGGPDHLYRYLRNYCVQDWDNKWRFQPGGLDRLTQMISANYVMRDRKMAGIVLPPQEVNIYNLSLTPDEYPEQYKYAQQLNQYAQVVMDEEKNASILYVIELILRKRQMMTYPGGIKFKGYESTWSPEVGKAIKIDKTMELISEVTADGDMLAGERVVVFSQFTQALDEIKRQCDALGYSVVQYTGATPDAIRDEVKLDFDRFEITNGRTPRWQICLANYKSGGVGLNFTDVTQTIILDEEWNPGKRDQAYGRTQRMGQTEETTIHLLRVENSIEDWMAGLIEQKSDMIEGFESKIDIFEELRKRMQDGDML